jgi:5-formyltetrahydrofolate cyclo-ligase
MIGQGPNDDGGDDFGEFASPPCFLHELDPAYTGLGPAAPAGRDAVMRWRRGERARLIAQRLATPAGARAEQAARIASHLDALLPALAGLTVSLYWPIRGEPDLRGWADAIAARGAICALPVVVERNAPLAFRTWRPGELLVRGFWNIPVPEHGTQVAPDIVLAPVVGFDAHGFRLGYGGGYFDRTLAALSTRPQVVGVGFAQAGMPTIHPLAHDIPMDMIVTDRTVHGGAAPVQRSSQPCEPGGR